MIPNEIEVTKGEFSDIVEIDDTYAYKGQVFYKVYETTKTYMADPCIGRIRYVFDEAGNVLATALPLTSFDNGFEMITKGQINKYRDVVQAFKKFQQ